MGKSTKKAAPKAKTKKTPAAKKVVAKAKAVVAKAKAVVAKAVVAKAVVAKVAKPAAKAAAKPAAAKPAAAKPAAAKPAAKPAVKPTAAAKPAATKSAVAKPVAANVDENGLGWVDAGKGYQLTLDAGKLAAKNDKGKRLTSVPKELKDGDVADQLEALRDWLVEHDRECIAQVEQWMLRSLPVPRGGIL